MATTSGTTGVRGIFLMDDRSLTVTNALVFRMMSDWLGITDVAGIVAGAVAGMLSLPMAVITHEVSEFVVIGSGLRLLRG